MREAVGGISLFNIVIVFVLLFTGYISLSINYSKAYNVKNEIVNIIKNQGGVCTANSPSSDNNCYNFAEQINDYFSDVAYHSSGNCDGDWVGYKRNGEMIGSGARNAAFCVRAVKLPDSSEAPNALYYQVKLFYQLDLPVFKSLFEFTVTGETARIYEPNECENDKANYSWC